MRVPSRKGFGTNRECRHVVRHFKRKPVHPSEDGRSDGKGMETTRHFTTDAISSGESSPYLATAPLSLTNDSLQALHGFEGEEEEEREEEKEMFVLRIRFYDWVHKQPWMDEMQSALGHCRRTAEKNLRELRVGMGKSQSRAGAGKRHSGEGADDSLEWYVEALCDALCFLGWSDACDLLSHLLWEGSPAIAAPAPSVRPLISAERNDDTEEAEHEEQAEREEQHLQARWASMERRVRSAICDAEEFGREFVKSSMAMRTKVKTLFARANNSTDGSCIDLNADWYVLLSESLDRSDSSAIVHRSPENWK